MIRLGSSVKRAKKSTKRPSVPRPAFSFRKNVLPPLIGLGAFTLCLLVMNLSWITAEVAYELAPPVRPHAPIAAGNYQLNPNAAPTIWIPAINVHAPIVLDTSTDPTVIEQNLENGPIHYPTTALPGQKSNVVIFGHSAGLPWVPGHYKFVFTLLNKLQSGDQVVVTYKGTRYIYTVTDKTVVSPTDMRILQPTTSAMLSIVTCTPVGTSQNRLVVHAQQVSPAPSQDQAPTPVRVVVPKVLPGNTTSVWQSLSQLF